MIYDITQELFGCNVFPGDPAPERKQLLSIKNGDVCNLTLFSMCAHNGTHLDAPLHFIDGGKAIDELLPESFVGCCSVLRHEGDISGADAKRLLDRAHGFGAPERILIAGKATVTEEAAKVFAKHKLRLFGNESQSVGPEDALKAVHLIMLGAQIVLLEGIVLDDVPEGKYYLCAAPLKLGGCDGAPCRAILIEC